MKFIGENVVLYYTDRGETKAKRSHFIAKKSVSYQKNETIRDLHVDKRKLPFKFQNTCVPSR